MSTLTRQSNLFAAEDWRKLYNTFRSADFQSYDYETLRKSMVDYLRTYYPEDFNDYIESSEFSALLDLLSFMGQSISYRSDLNYRENFIQTAERRDSVYRMANMLGYSPSRNNSASGMLKNVSVQTTEEILEIDNERLEDSLVILDKQCKAFENMITQNNSQISGVVPASETFLPLVTGYIDDFISQIIRKKFI